MTPDPDVTPVGFAATDAAGATMRRQRNPAWLILALVLLGAGIAGITSFVVKQLDAAPGRSEAVAEGRVAALGGQPTSAVSFTGSGGDHTIWLDLHGVFNDNTKDTIIAATGCRVSFDSAGGLDRRGSRQGSAVTIGSRSTVGTFNAPEGTTTVACALQPFGGYRRRGRLDTERDFFITAGTPGVAWTAWAAMFAGTLALFGAIAPFRRWVAGRLRPA